MDIGHTQIEIHTQVFTRDKATLGSTVPDTSLADGDQNSTTHVAEQIFA